MMISKHFLLFYPEGIMLPWDAQHKGINRKGIFKVTTEVLRTIHLFDCLVFCQGKGCVAHCSSTAISQVCANRKYETIFLRDGKNTLTDTQD